MGSSATHFKSGDEIMGEYCNIPKEVVEQINEFIELDKTNIEEELENNITYESILNSYIYESTDKLIEYESRLDEIRSALRPKYMTGNTDADDAYNNLRLNKVEIDYAIDPHRGRGRGCDPVRHRHQRPCGCRSE